MVTLLIAGTDTGVGKTLVTTLLAAYWRQYAGGQSLGLMKLLQTGIGDREHYQALFGDQGYWDLVTPQQWQTPVAPPIAALREGQAIALDVVWQKLRELQGKHPQILVEGLGSLGSPVTEELTVADLAGLWKLETLLVVPVQLGAMGQAIAQVALARQCKVKLRGLVLSCHSPESAEKLQDWADPDLLSRFTQLPILGIIPPLKTEPYPPLEKLAQMASDCEIDALLLGLKARG
ncbi:MAG: dethiobiotin synthase [Merismopediaceae bacterium]|nr:dethiobiotin synthase [Merismopediaceae bacterium]